MPPSDALLSRYASYGPTTSARDINLANAVTFRNRQQEARIANPGMPEVMVDPGWDAFHGGLEHNAQDAADQGKGFGVNYGGLQGGGMGTTATAALLKRAAPPDEGDINDKLASDAFENGQRQLATERGMQSNMDMLDAIHRNNATDPDLDEANAIKAREKLALDTQAANSRAIDTFGQTEGLRNAQEREAVQHASAMYPFQPGVIKANEDFAKTGLQNEGKRDVAGINAAGRETSSATSAFGRVSAAPTFTPEDTTRVNNAIDALRTRAGLGQGNGVNPVPGPKDPNKIFPAARLGEFAQQYGFQSPDAARAYIEGVQGYTIR